MVYAIIHTGLWSISCNRQTHAILHQDVCCVVLRLLLKLISRNVLSAVKSQLFAYRHQKAKNSKKCPFLHETVRGQ